MVQPAPAQHDLVVALVEIRNAEAAEAAEVEQIIGEFLKKLGDTYRPEDLEKMIRNIRSGKEVPSPAVKTNGQQ